MFYKQRAAGAHPAWAYTLPTTFLRAFYSATEAGLWSIIVYWTVGFAPDAGRSEAFPCGCCSCPAIPTALHCPSSAGTAICRHN